MSAIDRIPLLGQRDPRWSAERIGRSSCTVGSDGCLLTCIAMLTWYYGHGLTPDALAADARLFTTDGLLRWRRLDLSGFSLRWLESERGPGGGGPDDSLIRAYLPRPDDPLRRSVVVAVARNSHWVLPIRYDETGGDYEAFDPKTASTIRLLATYGSISFSAHFVGHPARWRWVGRFRGRPKAPGFD